MPEVTMLPPATDARWRDVVTGKISKSWDVLALKIMMTRITSSIKADPSPDNVDKCIHELRTFFEKNMTLAQNDLRDIFG